MYPKVPRFQIRHSKAIVFSSLFLGILQSERFTLLIPAVNQCMRIFVCLRSRVIGYQRQVGLVGKAARAVTNGNGGAQRHATSSRSEMT